MKGKSEGKELFSLSCSTLFLCFLFFLFCVFCVFYVFLCFCVFMFLCFLFEFHCLMMNVVKGLSRSPFLFEQSRRQLVVILEDKDSEFFPR